MEQGKKTQMGKMFRFSVKQDTVFSLYSLLTILAELSSALYYVDGLPRFDEKKPVYKLGLLLLTLNI